MSDTNAGGGNTAEPDWFSSQVYRLREIGFAGHFRRINDDRTWCRVSSSRTPLGQKIRIGPVREDGHTVHLEEIVAADAGEMVVPVDRQMDNGDVLEAVQAERDRKENSDAN